VGKAKKGGKGGAGKGIQTEADRLAAIANAYGIPTAGGRVTSAALDAAAKKRALAAEAARAKAQAKYWKDKLKSKDKWDPDKPKNGKNGKGKGGEGKSSGLTEAERLANELARLKIKAEMDKADREAQKVLDDAAASAEEKAEAIAERQRKFAAYSDIANIYAAQGKQTDTLYGTQLEGLPSRKQGDLDVLLQAVSAGQKQITDTENQFLSSLVKPKAYSDVPLVDLSTTQPVNPLLGALGAEGASTAGVTGQSAMDAALAAQYAQLARNTANQLNVGAQNYMTALRNAGVGAAAAGRQELAQSQTHYQNLINAKYADLANQLAMQRLQAQQEADIRTAQAKAEAAIYGETPKKEPGSQPQPQPQPQPVVAQPVVQQPVIQPVPMPVFGERPTTVTPLVPPPPVIPNLGPVPMPNVMDKALLDELNARRGGLAAQPAVSRDESFFRGEVESAAKKKAEEEAKKKKALTQLAIARRSEF